MGRVIIAGGKLAMKAPSAGIALSTLTEGSIVKLNENGSPVEFYVAKHNYESGLNGSGRTLVVRASAYDKGAWNSSNVNAYASSTVDIWLNGTYKGLLDADVKSAIGTTKFYYTSGNGSTSVTTLSRSIFLLSLTELGLTASYANTEGSALPIAGTLRSAYPTTSNYGCWTRSPRTNRTDYAYDWTSDGKVYNANVSNTGYWRIPAFTLPSTAFFDEETLEFKGVS